MTTWLDGSKTGDFAFIDSNGIKRYRGRTCNLYGSTEDVIAGFAHQRGPSRRATVYIYRTVDGLYDGTVRELGEDRHLSPEFVGAELVGIAGPDGVMAQPQGEPVTDE